MLLTKTLLTANLDDAVQMVNIVQYHESHKHYRPYLLAGLEASIYYRFGHNIVRSMTKCFCNKSHQNTFCIHQKKVFCIITRGGWSCVMRHQSSCDLKERVEIIQPSRLLIFKKKPIVYLYQSIPPPLQPFQYNAQLYWLLNKLQYVEQC